jgi:hypothetical protein
VYIALASKVSVSHYVHPYTYHGTRPVIVTAYAYILSVWQATRDAKKPEPLLPVNAGLLAEE